MGLEGAEDDKGIDIVQEIGSLFGGSLDVQSAAGMGFKVTVRFPLTSRSETVQPAN